MAGKTAGEKRALIERDITGVMIVALFDVSMMCYCILQSESLAISNQQITHLFFLQGSFHVEEDSCSRWRRIHAGFIHGGGSEEDIKNFGWQNVVYDLKY